MSKSAKYGAKESVDELEELSSRLAEDLHKSIRALGSFPLLSEQWCEMADTFGRIASISDMESRLSASKSDGTLWETEEQALRFVLEDGKLNLCLRNMIEYKQYQRSIRSSAERSPLSRSLEEKCDKFEKGLGGLLRNIWQHSEALQTTDVVALLNHIADVFEAANDEENCRTAVAACAERGDLHQRQEVLVYYYLASLMKEVDSLGESRVMSTVRERKILTHAAKFLSDYSSSIPPLALLKAVESLSMLVETEAFTTERDAFLPEDLSPLLALRSGCLTELMKDFDNRKVVRPLTDCIDRAKRLRERK